MILKTSIIDKFLEDNGWYFSHNIDGWDNHYYSDNGIPIDIILNMITGDCDFYINENESNFEKHYKYIYLPDINDIKNIIRCFKLKKIINGTNE